jgi:oleandomycin transport system permease protein
MIEGATLRRRRGPLRALSQLRMVTRRNLLHLKADPAQIAGTVIQPVVFLVLFVYVLGGAIAGSSSRYLQFLLPGLLVLVAALSALQGGQRMAGDYQLGVTDRLRSLPVSASAAIGGRVLADVIRMVVAGLVLLGTGMVLGFRSSTGVAGMVGGILLAAAFTFTLCWPMAYLGIGSKRPESVSTWGFLVLLPLLFASSIFAPVDSMPGWLASLVEVNPITALADSVRGLMVGGAVATPLTLSLAWMAGFVVIFGMLAIRRYRARS